MSKHISKSSSVKKKVEKMDERYLLLHDMYGKRVMTPLEKYGWRLQQHELKRQHRDAMQSNAVKSEQRVKIDWLWLWEDWRVWALAAILLAIIILTIISYSNNVVVNKNKEIPTYSIDEVKQSESQPMSESQQVFKDVVMGSVGSVIVEWMDVIVLLIVLGFIISVFVKMSRIFK
jgi:hypothetical protein